MAKHSILLTGFEPFDGSDDNPSKRVVERLARARVPGAAGDGRAAGVCPPSTEDPAEPAERPPPGRGADARRVARLALRPRGADRGEYALRHHSRQRRRVIERAADRIRRPGRLLGHAAGQGRLRRGAAPGIPCVTSFSAGAYLCNQVMYLALRWSATRSPATRVGFLHLPSLPSQIRRRTRPSPNDGPVPVRAGRARRPAGHRRESGLTRAAN